MIVIDSAARYGMLIRDAEALEKAAVARAAADVRIAMATGSEVAMRAAGITMTRGDMMLFEQPLCLEEDVPKN